MSQRCTDNIKKVKAGRYSARDFKNLSILPENLGKGLTSRREHIGIM